MSRKVSIQRRVSVYRIGLTIGEFEIIAVDDEKNFILECSNGHRRESTRGCISGIRLNSACSVCSGDSVRYKTIKEREELRVNPPRKAPPKSSLPFKSREADQIFDRAHSDVRRIAPSKRQKSKGFSTPESSKMPKPGSAISFDKDPNKYEVRKISNDRAQSMAKSINRTLD